MLRGVIFLMTFAKPFITLVVLGLICLPIRLAVERRLPDGRLKRLLLLRLTKR